MIDIALKQYETGIDIEFDEIDVVHEESMNTSILISLFSDARCLESELPKDEEFRRGFWGDALEKNVSTGSKLWLFTRAKTLNETLEKLKEITKESLTWMVKDGLASSIEPFGEIVSSRQINFGANIFRPDGKNSKFYLFWTPEGIRHGI